MNALNQLIRVVLTCSYVTLGDAKLIISSSPRKDLTFMELARYDGYRAEHHLVTTRDGYVWSVFRVPAGEQIMFMHGLYLSGDDCIVPGPGQAHCYVYSDNCYDVWAPNTRGNFYSRNHTTYDPDKDSEFWNFSIDELALYDLSACIDHVLDATRRTQLSFVGHSQGATMLLILCAKMPEYNAKIKIGIGLSVTAWLDNAKFIVIQLQGALTSLLTAVTNTGVHAEILARGSALQSSGRFLCGTVNLSYPFCSIIIFAILGYNRYQITEDTLPVIVGHSPSGTSLKNFNRWGQFRNQGFVEYDYGTEKNMILYGQNTPPEYDMTKVRMKWRMIGSLNDFVANVTDVKLLVSKLPDAELCVLPDDTFGHLDFIYGKDVPNHITPRVLAAIHNDTLQCL